MFSRIIVKLIDEAIVPAILLIAAKVVGVIVAMNYFGIASSGGESIFTLYFSNQSDFLKVNSFSTFLMYLVVFFGGLFFFVKSRYFHSTHVKPQTAAKLFSFKLGNFIQTSFDIYSEGTIWLSYSYLMTVILGIELYFNLVYSWIALLSFVLSVFLTLIFISDVDQEFERKNAQV